MISIYEFKDDEPRLREMQKATLGVTEFGVSPLPALVGTPAWWAVIAGGLLESITLEGQITRVYWGSMGDWPEFELTSDDGTKSSWTRMGDISRYVEGLGVRLRYVRHPWKVNKGLLGAYSQIVLSVEIDESALRSDPRVPGILGARRAAERGGGG